MLQFGCFKIHFMKIQFYHNINEKFQKIQYIFHNFKIPLLKNILSISESVKFLLIESVIFLFTDSPVKKYISLLNQLIVTT